MWPVAAEWDAQMQAVPISAEGFPGQSWRGGRAWNLGSWLSFGEQLAKRKKEKEKRENRTFLYKQQAGRAVLWECAGLSVKCAGERRDKTG